MRTEAASRAGRTRRAAGTDAAAYETVARAIRYLREHAASQPRLAEVAAAAGLSEFHLQRLFGDWAGVSPKRFLQYLTKEHAKAVLRASHAVLDAALATGLSGPGRLHDLLVACDAATPGEVRTGGAGLEIAWGLHVTPLGRALVATTARGVCRVEFADDEAGACRALDALRRDWPRAALAEDAAATAPVAGAMFGGARPREPLRLWLRGTNFQVKVWEALVRIPPGALLSYARLAGLAGVPGAARAVGSACAANVLAVLVPCHRVIRENGVPGDYRWGPERKQALIAREAAGAEPGRGGDR